MTGVQQLPDLVRTKRFELRRLCEADADDLFTHLGDPEVTRYLDFHTPRARQEVLNILAWTERIHAAGTGIRWGLREHGCSSLIGTFGFHLISFRKLASGQVGYDLARSHWGRGVMGEVLETGLALCDGVLLLDLVEAHVTPGNLRSRRLLERHGFTLEGTIQEYAEGLGKHWDQWLFARTRLAGNGNTQARL